MKPSKGRIVFYCGLDSNGQNEHPAIVTRVWTDECVNLTVFPDAAPMTQSRTSVLLNKGETTAPNTWRWPPREE